MRIPDGTYWDNLRRLRRERGNEADHVPEGKEVDAARAIRNRMARRAAAETREFEEKDRGQLDTKDIARMTALVKLTAAIEAAERDDEPTPRARGPRDHRAMQRQAIRARAANPQSLLSQLRDAESQASTTRETHDPPAE